MGLTVVKNLVEPSKYSIKCPYSMTPEFIVVHNTANDATAANEIAYMIRNNNEVSYHYAIDDKQIVQGVPENRNAWHASDGGSGKGNRKGIGIEICYSLSGGAKFVAAEKLAAKFIAEKLKEKGWGVDKVKKHQDFSAKYCPHRTLDMGWQRFIDMVSAELKALNKTEVKEVKVNSLNGTRWTNHLVMYFGRKSTGTNEWGAEAPFDASGKCISDPVKGVGNMKIPDGGFVLSAHGTAAKWLLANVKKGTKVNVTVGV